MTTTETHDAARVEAVPVSVPLGSRAVVAWLRCNGWRHQLFEHRPTFHAMDEAAVTGMLPYHVAKTVVLQNPAGLLVAAVPACERLDLRKVRRLLGGGRPRLATEAEIAAAFPTVDVGAVPPLGPLLGVPALLDRRLTGHPRIVCSAGDHRHALVVNPADLERLGRSRVADLCED